MANCFFEFVFEASMRASLLILTVFLLKALLRHKMNHKWHTVIWVIVAVRLVIPWAPQSPLSLFNAVKPAEKVVRQVWKEHKVFYNANATETYGQAQNDEKTEMEKETPKAARDMEYKAVNTPVNPHTALMPESVLSGPGDMNAAGKSGFPGYITWIWLSGSLLFTLLFLVFNKLLHKRMKSGIRLDSDRINQIVEKCGAAAGIVKKAKLYETEGINSPMLYGIWRPTIMLPRGMTDTMTDTELRHIILHEMIHLRKRDNIRWMAVLLIRAIHWFNPLVHLAAADYKRSHERYCDSLVLELLDEGENTGYGRTLVRLARGYRRSFPSVSSAIYEGAGSLEKRIRNIARFTKGTCRWSIAAVIILALAACAGLSDEIDTPQWMHNLEPEEIHIYTQYKPYQANTVNEVENMLSEVSLKLSDSMMVTPVFHWLQHETYADEIDKLIKSGERVDAFTTYGGYSFGGRDVFMDLTALFPKYAPNYYSELISHDVGLEKLQNSTVDGKLICVPNNDILTERTFVVARKDLVELFAQDGFETLEDYGRFLAQVKDHNAHIIPGSVNPAKYFQTYLQGNGLFEYQTTYFYKSWDPLYRDEYYPMERTDEFASAYYMLKEWYDKGYVKGNINTVDYMSAGGLASVLINGRDIGDDLNRISSKYQYLVDPLYMEKPHSAFIVSRGVSVGKTCACPERVMMFLEWMHASQEAYDLFVYGVENRNYTLKGNRVSFASDEFDIKAINGELVFDFFRDFRYDRLYEYQPDDYREMYQDACLKNIITTEDINEKVMGISKEDITKLYDDPEAVGEYVDELGKTENTLEKYWDNMSQLMDQFSRGFFLKEPEEIVQMQKETGIDKRLEIINKTYEKMRGE